MILKQLYLACLSQASYFLGDERTHTAVVVDPRRDIEPYLAEAAARGMTIRHVFLTHFHADFVAGHLELAARCGAAIHLGAAAHAEYPFVPMKDGDVMEIGDMRLTMLATPGHTPEGISIVVHDLAKDRNAPQAVLTGDTLFIGDVGRPDLMASVGMTAAELASLMYDSLHQKLLKLPDATLVYPGHGAGSACGKNMSSDTVSTIGAQRVTNVMLRPMTREQFVASATGDLPPAPAYFAYDAALNKQHRPTLDESMKLASKPLSLDEVLAMQEGGAILLDVREAAEYEPAHLAGSLNIGLGGRFASWVGTLLDPKRPIVIVASSGKEVEAMLRLGRVGFDRVAGFLRGGAAAFAARPDLVRSFERFEAKRFSEALAHRERNVLLDVRALHEWNESHIEGSLNIPLADLERRIAEVPRGKRIALHCQSGYRSSVAAGILERNGIGDLADLIGGIAAWKDAGLPVAVAQTAG